MLISACLIAKNEALTLPKCLESLQGVADEIILVDTGSTDSTIEIAESFGCKVFHYEWTNDFAAARNVALRHAQGEFMLTIDADEFIEETHKQKIRDFLAATDAEGIFITVKNYLGSLSNLTSVMGIRVMRIFRRGHFYSGTIHEQVADSVARTKRPITSLDVEFHHLGYTTEFLKNRGKSSRNTELLEEELANEPDNLFQRSNLIAEYVLQRDWPKCIDLAKDTWNMIRKTPPQTWVNFTPRIVMNLLHALWESGKKEEATKLAKEAVAYFPWFTDMKKRYANMLADTNHLRESVQVLMECRQQGDTKSGLIEFLEGTGTYLAAFDLGVVWTWLGDELNARRWFLQAFQENPSLDQTIIPIVALAPNDPEFLYEHFEKRLVRPTAYENYTETYVAMGYAQAESVIERMEQKFGISESTLRSRMALLSQQDPVALEAFVDQTHAELAEVLYGIFLINQGDDEKGRTHWQQAGIRGQYLLKAHELLSVSKAHQWGSQLLLREFIAMRAGKLLKDWLPSASDLHQVWINLTFSPLRGILEEIEWPGRTVHECEKNALHHLKLQESKKVKSWLKKAHAFEPTVTQVIIETNLAHLRQDLKLVRKTLYEGKMQFPDSELIQHLSSLVHVKQDPVQLSQQMMRKP